MNKTAFTAVLGLAFSASVALGAESPKEPTKDVVPAKQDAVSTLDTRINKLQKTRDCIDSAKTKDAIKECRKLEKK